MIATSGGTRAGYSRSGTQVVIDNVAIDFRAVPEPASWALIVSGFAWAGAAMRRSRTRLTFA